MNVPSDIASLRGSAFLTALAQFSDAYAIFYRRNPTTAEALRTADAFTSLHNICLALRVTQEDHIQLMAKYREEKKFVYSETDTTVDAVIAAGRSAFFVDIKAGGSSK